MINPRNAESIGPNAKVLKEHDEKKPPAPPAAATEQK
jgi:hypothetical protein